MSYVIEKGADLHGQLPFKFYLLNIIYLCLCCKIIYPLSCQTMDMKQ